MTETAAAKSFITGDRPVSERMALSVMGRYTPDQLRWHYEHGLVLQSVFLLGKLRCRDACCRYVQSMYDALIDQRGDILSYRQDDYNLDQINPGKTLFLLYHEYGEEKYRFAIEKLREQLRRQPRTSAGGFWHKQIYPWQMWLDGLYMQGPFYAQYAAEYGGAGDIEDVVQQFILMESKARDGQTGLLYHAWDESRAQQWADPGTGCSPHFWGRAMGWYCMALVDVLELIPPGFSRQLEELKAIAVRLTAAVLEYQDSQSGLWYQVLDRRQSPGNYTESSASAMFIYFLLKLLRLDAVLESDAARIRNAADKAFQGLLREKIREDPSGELHLTGICKVAGLGGTPYRDGSYEYYVGEPVAIDDFKGVGPFILAAMEWERHFQENAS